MWESLATSRRSDRVLHGAAKLLNFVVGAIALPAWLFGQGLRDPFRRLLSRLDPEPPSLPVAQPRERSMDALMADLEAIPHRLRHSETAVLRKGLADISSFVLAQQREAANLGYAYPAQFSDHVLRGADDEHIAATVGLQQTPQRPGLILVHGLFSSRRFDYVRQIAVRAYYDWGFNVVALDLRSFGLTNLTSQAPTTVGWKEGEDVVAAGRYLKQLGATTVGALGISLGGSAVLGACHAEGAAEALDGGILAVSPPADVKAMAKRLSRRLPLSHPAYPINRGFRAMLTSRIREAGWMSINDFVDPIERVSAPYYGVEADELWRRASAKEHIADAGVPVLVLHPDDDRIIPVEHARMLAEAAKDNDLVRVWVLPGGGHGAIDAVDREWFYAVARGFFERWAGYGEHDAPSRDSHADQSPAKLIYSAAR
ncbi:MAG TPA: alpha/beta hydrolase [Solirubrobacterales bacterium]|nr:alpha/beta hydrolase [Solirubrobacterales bacterium]